MKFRASKPMHINAKNGRWGEMKQQIKERGFADSELWSLDYTIASFVLPRLKQFRKKLCFSNQACFDLFLETFLSANGFKGHFAFELIIVTYIYFSYPPFSNEINNAKMIDSFTKQGPFRVLFLRGFSVLTNCRAALFFSQFSLPRLREYTYQNKKLQ